MSPELQRIAIAELCGWTVINAILCDPKPEIRNGEETGDVDMNPVGELPDYLNDLNAMHEAEKSLGTKLRTYASKLQDVCQNHAVGCVPDYQEDLLKLFYLIHATAAQRAEAFLRTLNKWEEHRP